MPATTSVESPTSTALLLLRPATDEELILHAWQLWGEEAFPELLGDFSFALWNSLNRSLVCVRDLLGLKPFFYAQGAKYFSFGNTLDMSRAIPEVSSTLDPLFIADFLLQEWSADADRTAYKDIRRLPPGHFCSSETAIYKSAVTRVFPLSPRSTSNIPTNTSTNFAPS
jgi:asparagine synthase (glutamine-hydrolysing)